MSPGTPVAGEPTPRPTVVPPIRISEFSYDDEAWPHPGANDNGPIRSLFAYMLVYWPPELRDGDGFLTPSPEQMKQLIYDSGTDVQVAVEQYLKGLERGRRWSDERMQELYENYLDRSLSNAEMAEVIDYAIREHGI